MIKWEIIYTEFTVKDLEFFEAFWLSDFDRAIGFRCEVKR